MKKLVHYSACNYNLTYPYLEKEVKLIIYQIIFKSVQKWPSYYYY